MAAPVVTNPTGLQVAKQHSRYLVKLLRLQHERRTDTEIYRNVLRLLELHRDLARFQPYR